MQNLAALTESIRFDYVPPNPQVETRNLGAIINETGEELEVTALNIQIATMALSAATTNRYIFEIEVSPSRQFGALSGYPILLHSHGVGSGTGSVKGFDNSLLLGDFHNVLFTLPPFKGAVLEGSGKGVLNINMRAESFEVGVGLAIRLKVTLWVKKI